MKQGYWTKASFPTKKDWEDFKEKYLTEKSEEGSYLKFGIQIITARQLGYRATYDEEGEILTEAGVYDDFSVDLISDVEILELEPYIIEARDSYIIGIGSFVGELVVKKKEKK